VCANYTAGPPASCVRSLIGATVELGIKEDWQVAYRRISKGCGLKICWSDHYGWRLNAGIASVIPRGSKLRRYSGWVSASVFSCDRCRKTGGDAYTQEHHGWVSLPITLLGLRHPTRQNQPALSNIRQPHCVKICEVDPCATSAKREDAPKRRGVGR
jgi:hypothetical protein